MNTRANWQSAYGFRSAPSGQVAGAQPSAALYPLQLAGLVGFWRADQGVGLISSNVNTWADQSGNSNTLTVVGGAFPTFNATGFNTSFPGITFAAVNGVSQACLSNATFSFVSQAISVFVLADLSPTQMDDAGLVSLAKFPLFRDYDPGDFVVALKHAGATNTFTAYSNGGIGDSGNSLVVPYSPTLTMLGFTVDGSGNGNVWVNGAIVGSPTTGVASFGANPNSIYVGARPLIAPVNGYGLNGTIAFCGITSAEMNAGDWTNLRIWANANWGTAL